MTEIIKKDGYTINIETEEGVPSPWEAMDGNPPILVWDDSLYDHETELSMKSVFWKVDPAFFAPDGGIWKKLVPYGRLLGDDSPDFPLLKEDLVDLLNVDDPDDASPKDWQEAFCGLLPEPDSWRSADEYFGLLAVFCQLANIQCHYETVRGYSQGDAARVFVAATPEWLESVGLNPTDTEIVQSQLKNAVELWSAWKWGDVYYVASILRPNGEEVPDSCCGGFYGSDHEESGLLAFAENAIAADLG